MVREFTQPGDHSFAQPCTCPIFILLDDWWKICIVGLKLQTVQFIHVIIFFGIYSNCTALARLIWALSVISHHSGGGLFRLARFRPPASPSLDTRHDIYGRYSRETDADATHARLLRTLRSFGWLLHKTFVLEGVKRCYLSRKIQLGGMYI